VLRPESQISLLACCLAPLHRSYRSLHRLQLLAGKAHHAINRLNKPNATIERVQSLIGLLSSLGSLPLYPPLVHKATSHLLKHSSIIISLTPPTLLPLSFLSFLLFELGITREPKIVKKKLVRVSSIQEKCIVIIASISHI
jgi:hypothetical protein